MQGKDKKCIQKFKHSDLLRHDAVSLRLLFDNVLQEHNVFIVKAWEFMLMLNFRFQASN